MLSRLTVYGALFIARDNSILCGKPATVTHGHAPAVSLDNLQSSGGSFAFRSIGMTARDGQPCGRCGAKEWYASGLCVPCEEIRLKRYEDKSKENSKRYRQRNPEKVRDAARLRRENNPEKEKERKRQYQQLNPGKINAKTHRRRTLKTAAGGNYTAAEWNSLAEHYGGKCLCCGRTDVKLTADHVVPVSKGGTSNIDNIQPLCKSCNSRKRDKTIDYRPSSGLGRWIQRKLFG